MRCERCGTGISLRSLVDGAERRLVARGVLHILFNMYALRQLGPPTAELYGAGRMVIIYVIGGMAGFIVSTLAGAFLPPLPLIGAGTVTIGASAPIFALLGGLMSYSRRGGSSMIRSAVMGYIVSAAVMGILMPGIDNWAHAGGFAGGYLVSMLLRSTQAGADGPHGDRGRLPHRKRHRRSCVHRHRALADHHAVVRSAGGHCWVSDGSGGELNQGRHGRRRRYRISKTEERRQRRKRRRIC